MIDPAPPVTWADLQTAVARILRESGLAADIERTIALVRGTVSVDIYAEDGHQTPPITIVGECKHWKVSVPKSVVHGFRTVVADCGANWGFVVSSAGFQAGAIEAAEKTNVRLLSWSEFEELFKERWLRTFMFRRVQEACEPFVEYTEPINSRIFRKADALSPDRQREFRALREQSGALNALILGFSESFLEMTGQKLELPIRPRFAASSALAEIPEDLLDTRSLRQFGERLIVHVERATAEFDRAFGGRA